MVVEASDFQRDVVEASRTLPVVVDFWAPWCAPCRMIGPVLEALEREAAGAWRLVKVNTDVHGEVAMQHGITGIPAIKLFVDGEPRADFVGAQPRPMIESWLRQNLPAPKDEAVEAAKQALAGGDAARARSLLEDKLEHEPAHEAARYLLADLLLRDDSNRAAVLLDGIGDSFEPHDRLEALKTLAGLGALRERAAPEGIDATLWKRYQEAIAAFFAGAFEAAGEGFLEVMRASRALDEDGARRACVAMCLWLGDEHEMTSGLRRRLAALLY